MIMKKQIFTAILAATLISGMPKAAAFADNEDNSILQLYTGINYEEEWSGEAGRYLAQSIYPKIMLGDNSNQPDSHKGLGQAFAALNAEKSKEAEKTYQEILKEAKERLAEDPEYSATYTDTESYYVTRADDHIVSLLSVSTGYTGGAHGYLAYSGLNLDPKNGRTLKLSELVPDDDAFKELVKKEIIRLYPETEADLVDQYFEETPLDDMVWTAGYEGITCYFNEYTLGPYAIGAQTILIPYEGNEAIIAETAADVPESYGVQIPLGYPVRIGGRELIVYANPTDYDAYDSVSIYLDGEENLFDSDIYAYNTRPTYIKANGEEYLYLQYRMDDDYKVFDIYHLGEKAERIGTVDLGMASKYVEELETAFTAAITDPEQMLFSTTSNLISTADVQRYYRVGADGRPEATEPFFRISGERILKTKEDVSCEEVDEDGNVFGAVTVPAGTKMTLLRTDNESIVDLKLDDGKIVRLEVSDESWPHSVNGKGIDELFEGIMFAG